MTKKVRIENADTNTSVELVVEVWDDSSNKPKRVIPLSYPTAMYEEYITRDQWLVIREREKSKQ